jgi:DNA-binding IclR family transcriptional regulator
MSNLEMLGLVARGAGGRGFRLGWRIGRWGQIAAGRMQLPDLLRGPLDRLNEESGCTILLCAVAGGDAVVVQCLPARAAMRIDVPPGLMLNLPESPTARVCFAFQERERRRGLLDHAEGRGDNFRIDDRASFDAEVAGVQARHYSWGENKFGIGHSALAAPIFDRDRIVAAVTIMLASDAMPGPPAPWLVEQLLTCAQRCSRLLGSRHSYPRG